MSSNFGKNSLFECASQPGIANNSLKPPILDLKVVQGHRSMLVPPKRSSAVLVKQEVCVYLQPFSC